MASENIQHTTTANQPVGTALIVYGSVKGESPNGTTRIIQPNSPIFANERIITGNNGMVSIMFNDGAGTQLDLGRMSDVLIDEEVFQGFAPEDLSEAVAEVEDIQEALISGDFDPTIELEAPAAGPAAGVADAGGGSSFVKFDLTAEEVTPESGAETTGIELGFLDPDPDVLEPVAEIPVASDPVETVSPTPSVTPSITTIVTDTDTDTTPDPVIDDTPIVPPPPSPPSPFIPSAISRVVEEEAMGNNLVHGAGDFWPLGADGYDSSSGFLAAGLYPPTFYSDGNPDDIQAPDVTTPDDIPQDEFQPDSAILTGNLAGSLTDGPASFSLVTTANLPQLWSQGEEVNYYLDPDGQFILAYVGEDFGEGVEVDRPVFSLEVTADGQYRYIEYDQLDHTPFEGRGDEEIDSPLPPPNENIDLQSGPDHTTPLTSIDFSGSLQAIQDGSTINFADGMFSFIVVDDIPIAVDEPEGVEPIRVLEDGLDMQDPMIAAEGDAIANNPDLSLGNRESGETTSSDEAMATIWDTNSISHLFKVGADEFPGSEEEGPEALYGVTTDTSLLNGLPTLYSHDTLITYSSDGQTLTASAGENVVFTFRIDPNTGSWYFDLEDQLDHVAGGGENIELKTSPDGTTSITGIDFSSVLTATDFDNDMVTGAAPGSFVFEIVDDKPELVSFGEGEDQTPDASAYATFSVQEDALDNDTGNPLNLVSPGDVDNSTGTPEGPQTDHDQFDLNNVVRVGADEELSWSVVDSRAAAEVAAGDYESALTSAGKSIFYAIDESTNTITGYTMGDTAADPNTVIFTFSVDKNTGVADFDLDGQIDHVPTGDSGTTLQGSNLSYFDDLGQFVMATDFDDDSVFLGDRIQVTVENDVPTIALNGYTRAIGQVHEDALGNELEDPAANDTDQLNMGNLDADQIDTDTATLDLSALIETTSGADENPTVTYSIIDIAESGVDSGYFSKGTEIKYYNDNGMLVAKSGTTTVFTFSVDEASGQAIFNLNDQIDHFDSSGDDLSLSINNLGSFVQAVVVDADGDSDSVLLTYRIVVNVENDVPTIDLKTDAMATGQVHEDALGNELEDPAVDDTDQPNLGNLDAGQIDTDTTIMDLSALIETASGADEDPTITYSITNISASGFDSGYFSKGTEIKYFNDSGTLVAKAGATTVFTFTVDSTSGQAVFNLNDQIDHSDGSGDEVSLAIDNLGSFVQAEIEDADGDTDSVLFTDKISVNVENDVPTITLKTGTLIFGQVHEDALGNELADPAADDTDQPNQGNLDEGQVDTDTATLDLSAFVETSSGADEETTVTYSITDIDGSGVDSGYFSKGTEIKYFNENGTLVAKAGATTVFTFTVDENSGQAVFNLDDQIDHRDGSGDNVSLPIENLGSYVQAIVEDADGDTDSVLFTDRISINVENDVPTIGLQAEAIATGQVHEDALGNELEDPAVDDSDEPNQGNLDDDQIDTDTATLDLSALIYSSTGADEEAPVTYAITDIAESGNDSGYSSNGIGITYFNENGTLVAKAGATTVFTFTVDAASGLATFNLNDQIDHPEGYGDDASIAIDNLGSYVQATIVDEDGDSDSVLLTDRISVNVENDVPQALLNPTAIVGEVLEDGLSSEEGDLSDGYREMGETIDDDEDSGSTDPTDPSNLSNLFTSGADESLTFGVSDDPAVLSTLDTLYSGGEQLFYSSNGSSLTANTAEDGSGRTVFTLEVNEDGSWLFDLKDQLDHVDDGTNQENWDLVGSTETDGSIDFSSIVTATDADGNTTTGTANDSFRINVQDDVPSVGVPQDSILAVEQGNSVTGSFDILSSGADEPASITLNLVEGQEVMSISGTSFTNMGTPLFWHDNGDGSWSAVEKDLSDALDPSTKAITISVDEPAGTYTVTQNGMLDVGGSIKTIDFSDALNGGNTYEAIFGSGGTTATVNGVTTYDNGVFVWARASQDLSDPFGWDGSSDTWINDTETVNYANQGVGVGGGNTIDGEDTSSGRESDLLSIKFFSQVEVDETGNNQEAVRVNQANSTLLDLTSVTLVLDHLGSQEEAVYTLWHGGEQVSNEVIVTNTNSGVPKGGSSSDDFLLTVDNSQLTSGTVFDEIRLEASTLDGRGAPGTSDYRIQSAEVEIFQEGVDETLLIPVEIEDDDGDVIATDFTVTFDGTGNIDAAAADSADGDLSTSGMAISGSSEADHITGTDYNDTIDGKEGDDTIDGGDGDDTLLGGSGEDTIDGGTGNDTIVGNEGNDFLVGDIGDDQIYGDAGDDLLLGGADDDQIIGGDGADTIDGGEGDDIVVGDEVEFDNPSSGDSDIIDDGGDVDIITGGTDTGTEGVDNDIAGDANLPSDDSIADVGTVDEDLDNLIPPPDTDAV